MNDVSKVLLAISYFATAYSLYLAGDTVFLGKEDKIRFKEKFGFFSKKNKISETIWIHGASVGEILSVMPLIENLEKKKI